MHSAIHAVVGQDTAYITNKIKKKESAITFAARRRNEKILFQSENGERRRSCEDIYARRGGEQEGLLYLDKRILPAAAALVLPQKGFSGALRIR